MSSAISEIVITNDPSYSTGHIYGAAGGGGQP